jgi:peptidoglycan/xylan/chitin deacetylase (PgdA/CDA1 family)
MITMLIALYLNQEITQQFQYIINTFSQIYRIPCQVLHHDELQNQGDNNLLISYGTNIPPWQGKHIHIHESAFFGEGYLTQKSLPHTPLPRYKDLPVLYLGGERQEPFIIRKGDLIETNIDLIASSFFLLTRYEEIVNNDPTLLDEHERFPATASIAYKENFLHRPLVNEYFELLWNCIKEINPALEKKPLWDSKDFALCLTHDVDVVQKYKPISEALTIGGLLLKQHSLKKATARFVDNILVTLQKKNDPFDTFDMILNLERRYGATSTFFFMAESDYSGGYCLDNPKVKNAINKISASGAEIGLHAGYYSYNNLEVTSRQKANLTKTLKHGNFGCRQHFLRWKTPDTWRIQEKCGLSYDTTLCFADHEGFRAGICHPFQPFDISENRILNLWEIPLTIMDGSLFNYRKLSPTEGLSTVESYMNTVKKHQGILVLLWHNSFFDPDIYLGWTHIYEKILASAVNSKGLIRNADALLNYFIKVPLSKVNY